MGLRDLFKSNFARIAENTTKYYLELKTNYSNKFSDEIFLLATAGVLDAQNYIFEEHSIEIDTIIDMARKAVSQEQENRLSVFRRLMMQERLSSKRDILKHFGDFELAHDPLFDFIFSLEVALFTIDKPFFSSPSDVQLSCFKKANTISNVIRRTKEKYGGEALFTLVVAKFMESPQFEPIRKQLGIKG